MCDLIVNGALTVISLSPALYTSLVGCTLHHSSGHIVEVREDSRPRGTPTLPSGWP